MFCVVLFFGIVCSTRLGVQYLTCVTTCSFVLILLPIGCMGGFCLRLSICCRGFFRGLGCGVLWIEVVLFPQSFLLRVYRSGE